MRGHRWSLDDLVTAWFAAELRAAAPSTVADLGCGIGAVLLMLAWRFPAARCIGIEAQAESAALARRSIAWNGAAARCTVLDGDLREPSDLPAEMFDLISGTPPYLPRGTGREPTRALQAACHLELRGGIEAYCTAAASLLAPGGRFIVCHADVRRTAAAARTAGLCIAARLDVIPRAGKRVLFSVFAMADGATPDTASNELIVRDRHGQWTDSFRAVRQAMGMPT
jgi:tRNA1(Val) A37 N6-methylase TrmN6